MNTHTMPEWAVQVQGRRATLLNHLLLAAAIGGAVSIAMVYLTAPEPTSVLERLVIVAPFVASWLIVVIAWAWQGLDYRVRALAVVVVSFVVSVIVFARGGLAGSGRVWLLLSPVLAFVLIGPRTGIVTGIVSVLTYVFFTLAISQGWVVPQVAQDLNAVAPMASEGGSFALAVVVLIVILWGFNQGWLQALVGVSKAQGQLQAQAQELEAVNKQLRQQASRLQTAAEIARAGSSILDPERLLVELVRQIQEGFGPMGVYYVGLFMLDEARRFAVLRAATGEAGELLLRMGHRLRLDETSTVGWCIIHRLGRVALDVGGEPAVQFGHSLLSFTRSEIALPLRSRGRILGALSVQSTREAAFSEADLAILQMMADQVAVAIDNADLFSQTEAALEELRSVHQFYLTRAWREFLVTKPVARIDYSRPEAEPGDESLLHEAQREAVASARTVAVDGPTSEDDEEVTSSQAALVVPLKLRGQVIGTVALRETRHARSWTAEEIAHVETIAEQVALTVEGLRLTEETQRSAVRERLIGEITDKMRRALDMDSLMQTAVQETATALGTPSAFVQLIAPPGPVDQGGMGAGQGVVDDGSAKS